jgi:hypothetical protein
MGCLTRNRSILAAILVSALVLGAGRASADTARDQAIALADEGSKRLEEKNYAAAIEKFDAAFALVPVPVFALQAATALEMSGRLVDALARYRAAYEMTPDPSWSPIQRDAQATARQRHQRLAARTPRLIVALSGTRTDRVELDGKATNPEALAAGLLVDPGEHRVVAHVGSKAIEQRVALAEGQTRRIELIVPAEENLAPSPSGASPVARRDSNVPTPESTAPSSRTLGWVALGVGAAGVVVGGVTGVIALGKKADLEDRCPERSCPQQAWEDNDSYDRLRTISTIGFVVGAVGIGTGGVLLWTTPSPSSSRTARLALRATPGRVTIAGEF